MRPHIINGICRRSYYKIPAKQLTGFCYGHVILSKMHAVSTDFPNKFYVVIYNKGSIQFLTHCLDLHCYRTYLICRYIFHTQLNPPASTFQCHPYGVKISVFIRVMTNKLNHPPQAAFIIKTLSPSLSGVLSHSSLLIIVCPTANATPRSGRASSLASSPTFLADVSVSLLLTFIFISYNKNNEQQPHIIIKRSSLEVRHSKIHSLRQHYLHQVIMGIISALYSVVFRTKFISTPSILKTKLLKIHEKHKYLLLLKYFSSKNFVSSEKSITFALA